VESHQEVRVELPHFYGKENVETYLVWEMKVEQIFVCLHVIEKRKVPLATLNFQEHARSWWTQRETNVKIGRKSEILNWDELKMCMRRKFVLVPYVKKKKLREEIKELMEKGRNFRNEEKKNIRREKEFKEKFQALVRKKEEKEKRERAEDKRKAREEKEKREKVMVEKENTNFFFLELNQISITFYLL